VVHWFQHNSKPQKDTRRHSDICQRVAVFLFHRMNVLAVVAASPDLPRLASSEELARIQEAPGVTMRVVTDATAARMILWLCENEAQIEEIARGRLDVGFSGDYQEWHLSRTIAGF